MTLETLLAELHARQNDAVLPITVHVLRSPLRIALLDASGERREFYPDGQLVAASEEPPQLQEPVDHAPPTTQRVNVSGFEVARYHGGPA